MSGTVKLSDQQYAIMQVLWQLGGASAREVQQHLLEEGWAHTTIGTVLSRLEKKAILSSGTVGRERRYIPLIQESDVRRSMVTGLVSALFKGDSRQLLAHLVKEGEIDSNDIADIEKMLSEDKKV